MGAQHRTARGGERVAGALAELGAGVGIPCIADWTGLTRAAARKEPGALAEPSGGTLRHPCLCCA